MNHLAAYIDLLNSSARIFGGETYNIRNLDHAAAARLFQRLDGDMSPENLTCDGELDRATVQQRAARYRGAIAALKKMGFVQPADCVEY
jgi:hypothetical protein